jgi:hypothetical protein
MQTAEAQGARNIRLYINATPKNDITTKIAGLEQYVSEKLSYYRETSRAG